MSEHPITLTPDEVRRVLALEPGDTTTLTRAFDLSVLLENLHWIENDGDEQYWEVYSKIHLIYSPLGKPGDVLVCPVICVDDDRQYRPMPPPEHSYGESPTYSFRLTVVSVTPRIDGETWVVDAEVRRERL